MKKKTKKQYQRLITPLVGEDVWGNCSRERYYKMPWSKRRVVIIEIEN